jgi:hypothetical protein
MTRGPEPGPAAGGRDADSSGGGGRGWWRQSGCDREAPIIEHRCIDLSAISDEFVAAVGALVALVRAQVGEVGYKKWQNALRETLAPACADVKVRRMSMYLFRHVAIATWKAAGVSEGDVAKLCGHVGSRTARNHYASARHGWSADKGLARAGGGSVHRATLPLNHGPTDGPSFPSIWYWTKSTNSS